MYFSGTFDFFPQAYANVFCSRTVIKKLYFMVCLVMDSTLSSTCTTVFRKEILKYYTIYGYTQNTFIHLCRYCNGHIFIPGCAKYSLSQIECPDVSYIFDLVSQKAYNSPQFFIRFQARKRWFNVGIQPVKCISEDLIECEMTFNCHRGFCLIAKQYPSPNPQLDIPCITKIVHSDTEQSKDTHMCISGLYFKTVHFVADKLVLGLTSRAACHDSVSGGKAASLASMAQMQLREIQIPAGIVVTTKAFNDHLTQNPELQLKLEALEDLSTRVSLGTTEKSQLENHCERYTYDFP